jgi:hypothetical protein
MFPSHIHILSAGDHIDVANLQAAMKFPFLYQFN